jgi:1-acyl-sn-glycerol-3-phosphate acyltransferase
VLHQQGIYGIWRYPIYLCYAVGILGLGLLSHSGGCCLIVVPLFLCLEYLYVTIEERFLMKKFGEEYVAYKKRTPLIIPTLVSVVHGIGYILFRFLFSFNVEHRERIPLRPPLIILSAHRNYLDPFFIGSATTIPLVYAATFEIFRNPLSRAIFKRLQCIPRRRYKADTGAAMEILKLLRNRNAVVMFPEGERSWTGALGPFKPEVMKLLRHVEDVPIIPVRIKGNYESWSRWRNRFCRLDISVEICSPFYSDKNMPSSEFESLLREKLEIDPIPLRCASRVRHVDLRHVLYRCPVCRTMKRLSLGAEGVFKCNECAGELLLTPEMNVRFQTSDGQQFLSIDECYRSIRIEERDINNPQTPPLPVSFINPSERVIAAANGCELSKESGVRFTSLLSGEATLTNAALYVTTREERVRIALDLITSATIESNNPKSHNNITSFRLY